MSVRPSEGVVGTDFGVHGTRGLYVIDSSIFPTNLGVNPQNPIMGIAMHAYNDTYGALPTGWVTNSTTQPSPGWSWQAVILPYIEQENLYKALNPLVTTAIPAATAGTAIMTPLKVYRCPSDAGAAINTNYGSYLQTSYVVNREVLNVVTLTESSQQTSPLPSA